MPSTQRGQTLLMLMITLSLMSLLAMEGVTQTLLQLRMTGLVLHKQQALEQTEQLGLRWMSQANPSSASEHYLVSEDDGTAGVGARLRIRIETDEASGVIRILHWQEGGL